MSAYSYKCRSCDLKFDVLEVLLEVATLCCPFCREEVHRDYKRETNPIHFRAPGFYKTDNKKDK